MTRADIPRLPKLNETIDEYVIGKELGRGSMGVVYDAVQSDINRRVALKMMLPKALMLEGVVERFMRGARLASALRHPNAVVIYGVGVYQPRPEAPGLPYMVMEHLEGEDLYEYMAREGRISLSFATRIMEQALEVVADAHAQSIIHRDLKPENLFLAKDPSGEAWIKVLDFGLSKAVSEGWGQLAQRLTATGMTCGTPEYMAPEQAVGEEKVGPPLDVYALGCIFYHMLMGRPPFLGKGPLAVALKHVQEKPAPMAGFENTYAAAIIERCMAKLPRARFKDAGQMLEALRRGMNGENLRRSPGWPSAELLGAAFRPTRDDEADDVDPSLFPGEAQLAPGTLEAMPALEAGHVDDEWGTDTLQGTPDFSGELRVRISQGADRAGPGPDRPQLVEQSWFEPPQVALRASTPGVKANAMAPGAVRVDLKAGHRRFEAEEEPPATLITTDPDRPSPVQSTHRPTEPLKPLTPADAPPRKPVIRTSSSAAIPPKPQQGKAQGFVWVVMGIGLVAVSSLAALAISFYMRDNTPEVPPAPVEVAILIQSTPERAEVVDEQGKPMCATPCTLKRPRGTTLMVYLQAPNHERAPRRLHFGDPPAPLQVDLIPNPAQHKNGADWVKDNEEPHDAGAQP